MCSKRFFVWKFAYLAVLSFLGWGCAQQTLPGDPPESFTALRIAHAGGGIEGKTYTNSYQALDHNLQIGFVYFELDFVFTSDEQLVCLHDWNQSFGRAFGYQTNQKLSLKKMQELISANTTWTNCTLDDLADWMLKNGAAHIVTDVKERNLKALSLIAKKLPDAHRRVIPQIYTPENYSAVKEMGFEQIIWTLYRYPHGESEVLNNIQNFRGAFAITMPESRAKTSLPNALASEGIPTYVHTINSLEKADDYINRFGITNIYTDFLLPAQ